MSVFDPDTLKSVDIPSAALEVAQVLAAAEQAVASETPPNNITIGLDLESKVANVTMALPINHALDANGKLTIDAVDYLP